MVIPIAMSIESGYNRSFLENLVAEYQDMKQYNKKYNKNTSFENVRRFPWIPNSKQKLKHEFKKVG